MAKSWEEKFNDSRKPEVKRLTKKFADIPEGASMLIANPKIVAGHLQQIPKGHETDIKKMRNDLANEYGAEYTCPVTTAIFLRTVAEYAYEQLAAGETNVPPFWRAMDKKSTTLQKLSFGKDFVMEKRKAEGLSV